MRQLRLPRGLRLGPDHRAPRRGGDRERAPRAALPSYVGGDLPTITAQTVYEAAHDGDELALEVVRDTAKFLGAGVANLVNIFNPEVVVVCGGVTLAGDSLFVPLRREVARRAFKPGGRGLPDRAGRADRHGRRVRRGRERSSTAGRRDRTAEADSMPKLGVIGSLVWDVIHGRDPAAPPVEEWGGIAYALAGFDAALPADWEIVPLIKVGRDLRAAGGRVAPRARPPGARARAASRCRCPTTGWCCATSRPSGAASG